MYLAIDLFHFPEHLDDKEISAQLAESFSGDQLFVGRVVQDPARRFTHCVVWKYESFERYEAQINEFRKVLEDGAPAMGSYPGYQADHWYGFKVVGFDDPVLVEQGPTEWSRRDLQPLIDLAREHEVVADWMTGLGWWAIDNGDQPHRAAEYWMREQAGLPFKEY